MVLNYLFAYADKYASSRQSEWSGDIKAGGIDSNNTSTVLKEPQPSNINW